MSTANPPADQSPESAPATPAPAGGSEQPPRRRRWLVRGGLVLLVLVVVAGAGLGGAEYYTSRPSFCGTCHVMDPYYESWSRDPHGAKFGVACVECHYAPGEQHTIKAKFRGLSQVASYFSGRYGAGRPRAVVSDDSCLRSGCHGGRAFDSKYIAIGEPRTETRLVSGVETEVRRGPSVHFVHEKHLHVDAKRQEVEQERSAVRERLGGVLDEAGRARIERAAVSVLPAAERRTAMSALAAELGLSAAAQADALKLMDLEHRRIRVDQLAGLSCSACHAFNPTLNTHIAADRQVCFTCHFTHEEFNRNTGECLRCHEPPTRAVRVHDAWPSQQSPSVIMDHQDIVRRGVDCASCHLDVVRGDAGVTERECTHCHDQSRFLEEFATRTTETVRKYHEVHIAQQRAHCFDCHKAIQHGLLAPGAELATSAGFLEPVLSDCRHCHPNHHAEQVALLTGRGGMDIAHGAPSAMIGSRLNCRACHTEAAAGAKGDALLRATQEGCAACHGDDYVKLFDQWKHEIDGYTVEGEAGVQRIAERIAGLRAAGQAVPAEIETLLNRARANVELVRNAGGMHNRQYALQLLDAARRDIADAESQLGP